MTQFQWLREHQGRMQSRVPVSASIDRLIRRAGDGCSWNAGRMPPLTLAEIEAIATFAQNEIASASEREAAYVRQKSAEAQSESRQVPEINAQISTATGYLQKYGPVALLMGQMLSTKDQEGYEADWSGLPDDIPKDRAEFVLSAYALLQLNLFIGYSQAGRVADAYDALAFAHECVETASFWLGWHEGRDWAGEQRRKNAAKGGLARNALFRQLREWIVERYKAGTWNSPHQASHELESAAIEQAKILGTNLSPYRAQQTIYEWLLAAEKQNR
ncbi:hypothetical protein OKW45_005551 [Paraburkholderia sp. WSM4175]|uniref:hypothetical protein n=1 Tax=Paraburkholderia sp. WSM4175 TaxID=2991072 RepID=UPI003D223E59